MKISDVEIRHSLPSDVETVVALAVRIHEFGPPPWRNPAQMAEIDRDQARSAVLEPNTERAVLVAVRQGEVVGFVHLCALTDYYGARPHGHVCDLVVDPDHEGRGIGRALLEAGEAWARGSGYAWLTISVFEDNVRAARIYENAGFGRDLLKMVKPLD